MIIACVSQVEFNLEPTKHTVAYAEAARRMEFNTPKLSKLEHVAVAHLDYAKAVLADVVKEYLRRCVSVALDPADFSFAVCYETVDEAGRFHGHGGYSNCASLVHDANTGK